MRKQYGCHRKGADSLKVAGLTITGDATIGGAATLGSSLAVAGLATMANANVTGVLSIADGTVAAPALSFAADPDTGIYRPAANQLTVAAAAAASMTAAATSVSAPGAVLATTLQAAAFQSTQPTALQTITAVGNTITFNGSYKRLASDATRTLTSTPTIGAGTDGYDLFLFYEGANTLTLQDAATLAGSTLRLGAATRALSNRDVLHLRYSSAAAAWIEVAFANNL